MTLRQKLFLTTEALGAVLVLLGLLRVYMLFNSNGYLGPPFVFDVGDTFMDWFNTAYWAHNHHAYDVWRTIYLPLSFVITGALGDPRCYADAPYDARDCDVLGIVVILLVLFLQRLLIVILILFVSQFIIKVVQIEFLGIIVSGVLPR